MMGLGGVVWRCRSEVEEVTTVTIVTTSQTVQLSQIGVVNGL